MSKTVFEVAAELTQEVIKARAEAVKGCGNVTAINHTLDNRLSDEAVASLYKKVVQAIQES